MVLEPFGWKDKPALIEHLFPVQKISSESYKEQMAGSGKTLTALGSYWKGRKPLILNKACILGSLLPTTDDPLKDLEIFELLMGMDDISMAKRHGRIKPEAIARQLKGLDTARWFTTKEEVELPEQTPFDIRDYPVEVMRSGRMKSVIPKLLWQESVSELDRLNLEAKALPFPRYQENVAKAKRPEELGDSLFDHIWQRVNQHLGTTAGSMSELVEQMGIARFGHRPKVADVFSGSGQIPFEAARLGCDVYASDLNPIACMLTWGGFNIVGASPEKRVEIDVAQKQLAEQVQTEIDVLEIETDGNGWRAKVYLYCVEVKCPESGWMVPVISSLIISKGYQVIAKLIPIPEEMRYDIDVQYVDSYEEVEEAQSGTVQNGDLVHSPDGITQYRVSIKSIRGDYKEAKENRNRLRLWDKSDFIPRPDDIFQERLYCIQWMKQKPNGKKFDYDFRAVTEDDLAREQKVIDYLGDHLEEWQGKGYIPDMVIEAGDKTDEPIRTRGWSHWHHLFNPRQLLLLGEINKHKEPLTAFLMTKYSNFLAKLCAWETTPARVNTQGKQVGGASNNSKQVFTNQALNTMYNYGTRSSMDLEWEVDFKSFPISDGSLIVKSHPAQDIEVENDLYVTDPPYGDAVKYEEITEFFIAWLRKNPPAEFAHWTWDSRRSLAVKGEDEGFRQGMVAAYRKMAQRMPDNGLQVLMFTHQSGSIWADMANIIWASGLRVTAAWYVVTETDSALRQGSNVKGTIILILRKRHEELETYRDDLGWDIEEAVKEQVESLIGLDKQVRDHGTEGLYTDADLQMAGYAAALKVLTAYSRIDGKDMVTEAEAPRQKGQKTFVDELIDFAVQTAVQFLVPVGFEKGEWQKLQPVERFYLKMAEMEYQGAKTLDNYQNFAKAFKIHHFDQLMSEASKANSARLKLSTEFKSALMSGDAEIVETPLRALLYALFELSKEVEVDDVLLHLMENCPNYMPNKHLLAKMADYLAEKREGLKTTKTFKPDMEASNARVLAEAMRNQRL
jgi:putative DNA methylase